MPHSDEIRRRAVSEYLAGASSTVVARKYGVTPPTCLRWVREAGQVPRNRADALSLSWYSDEFRRAAVDEYSAGAAFGAVAVARGVGINTVRRWAREAGAQIRTAAEQRQYSLLGPERDNGEGYLEQAVGPDHWLYPYARARSCGGARRMLVHRRVMAEHIGRALKRTETVHHINGKRDDNRIENLELRASRHGPGQQWACKDCGGRNIEAVGLNA